MSVCIIVAERRVDAPVARQRRQAGERLADDVHREMAAAVARALVADVAWLSSMTSRRAGLQRLQRRAHARDARPHRRSRQHQLEADARPRCA